MNLNLFIKFKVFIELVSNIYLTSI